MEATTHHFFFFLQFGYRNCEPFIAKRTEVELGTSYQRRFLYASFAFYFAYWCWGCTFFAYIRTHDNFVPWKNHESESWISQDCVCFLSGAFLYINYSHWKRIHLRLFHSQYTVQVYLCWSIVMDGAYIPVCMTTLRTSASGRSMVSSTHQNTNHTFICYQQ